MKASQKKSGIAISYATEIVKILTSLLYTPIMLRLLGTSEYGLYQLAHSVVAYLGLFSFGFSTAYMRFYSRLKVDSDEDGIARLNGMFMTIFGVISILCLVCGGIMVMNVETIFATGLTGAEMDKARILLAIMVVNLAVTFPNTVFNNCVTAHERFIFQKAVLFLQALLNPFLTLPLLILGYGSVGMVVITTALTFMVLAANIFFCFKKLKVKFCFRGFQWAAFKEMFVFTFFLFLNQIIDLINWNVDKFLLGRMMNTTAVAIYSAGGLLNTLYMDLSKSISNVFVPQVNRLVAEGNNDTKLTQVFTRVGRMQFMILGLVMTGVIFFGRPFIRIWATPEYENAYYVAMLLVIPETIPLIQNIGIEVQRAKNMHKARSVAYLFMAILNIFISIWLIGIFGEVGAALGTTISLVVANIFFMNWYYHTRIKLNMFYFWKNIFFMCRGMIIPAIAGTLIMMFINTNGLLRLALFIIIYTIIYGISMWFLGINQDEKNQIRGIKNRLLRKKAH